MTKKILIDTDPGIDDSMAIFLALRSPELEVCGLTTVHGNSDVKQTTRNARQILDLAGRTDIPVAMGASRPLVRPSHGGAPQVHGDNGLGNISLPQPQAPLVDVPAAWFIVQQIMANPGDVTLVALGPLTNLALALLLEPRIVQAVHDVVLMGGAAFRPGNISPVAEANIYHDPEAAKMVFEASWPVTMVGLDVTTQVIMDSQYVAALAQKGNELTQFIAKITQCYMKFYREQHQLDGFYVHDSSAITYVLRPELFHTRSCSVLVQITGGCAGCTIADCSTLAKRRANTQVCVDVDAPGLLELYRERLTAS